MGTRKGRGAAIATVLAVVLLGGTLVWLCRDHIRFFLAFESIGPNARGYAEYRHRQTGIVFVSLPGGTFLMGSPEDEEGRFENEGPLHTITVSRFLISKFEVTQSEWETVMKRHRSSIKGENLPVTGVSWETCHEFCTKTELLLPTEAQWEYACRAGSTEPVAGTGSIGEMAWYRSNSGDQTQAVGQKRPNAFGIHDMHGNVSEWCADWYRKDFYEASSGLTDPVCEESGSGLRVLRGGSWCDDAHVCRSASRGALSPSLRSYLGGERNPDYVGFRLAARRP